MASLIYNRFIPSSERFKHGFEVFASPVRCTVQTITGVVDGFKACIWAGNNSELIHRADDSLEKSKLFLASPVQHFINIFRLRSFQADNVAEIHTKTGLLKKSNSSYTLSEGFAVPFIRKHVTEKARDYALDKNWFHKNLSARALYVASLIGTVFARALEFCVAALLVIPTILTLGYSDRMAHWTFTGLQITGIVKDLFVHAARIIRPWVGAPNYAIPNNVSYLK